MDIKILKEKDGSFNVEHIDFSRGGYAEVSVKCVELACDEVLLRNSSLSYLNGLASSLGMKVVNIEGPIKTIPIKVERGESARVKYLNYPVEIIPQKKCWEDYK
jgi:hypothetical protein